MTGVFCKRSDEPRKFSASQARRPAFAQHCARKSNSERELAQAESPVDFPCKLSRTAISREDSATLVFTVARVLGDFSPRTSRPSVALAVKGFTVCFVLKSMLLHQSSFSARREIPQTLRA